MVSSAFDMQNGILYLCLVIGSLLLEGALSKLYYLLTKHPHKTYHFSWGRYMYLLLLPLLATVYMAYQVNQSLIYVYFIFTFVGTALEWCIGYSYHQIVGQRLWTYHRYSINGYTSILAMPIWGMGGVLFWLLTQRF